MFRYECGNCHLVSEPYSLRRGAELRGKKHRDVRHDGLHPINEAILDGRGRMPKASEWKVFAIVAGLLLIALVSKALGVV